MKTDISVITKSPRRLALFALLCALFGVLWFILIRAVTLDTVEPHYHANFALYIDGQQELFSEGFYYEEVSTCGSDENSPKARVHLHDMEPSVVHVHDASATWGNFFENLGFTLGNNVLYARSNTYVDGQGGTLSFVLNGEPVVSVAGKTIGNEDVLLISYGDESTAELQQRYDAIEQNAAAYNAIADPSACQGNADASYWDRIRQVIGLD